MKIGFDGKRATNNLTGLGNYSRSLIAQLANFFPQNQYLVYTPKLKDNAQVRDFLDIKNIQLKLPGKANLLWRTFGIKKQLISDDISLFHGLSHEIPAGLKKIRIPAIVTVHDLIFLKFPQYFGRINRIIYTIKCKYACKHADKIVAISECTKRDLVAFFKIDPAKIKVVYQSCDDSFKTRAGDEIKEAIKLKYELPSQYILNVGTIEPRKNLITLIKALKHVNEAYKLVVVGKKTAYANAVGKEIDLLGLNSRVIFLQNVPFNDLPSIYQLADVFVYPSIYEGFGIPIIEALYSAVPVIAATGSCLEEAGGRESMYIAPLDYAGLATSVNNLLDSPRLREQMKKKGSDYVQRFNNEVISKEMMGVYKGVLSAYNNK